MSFVVIVLHLTLHMDDGLASLYVEIGGVDIRARRAQTAVERQRLVELSREMQIDILGQAAVVGVEVLVVPLVTAVERSVAICPAVVASHCQHVTPCLDRWCEVEAEGHHTIVREAHVLSVQVHVGPLTGTFEFYENLSLQLLFCECEVLSVPTYGIGEVDDVFLEGLVAVEGVG